MTSKFGDAVTGFEIAEDGWVDGNAVAGALREIFAFDVTDAQGSCAACGHAGPLGEVRVYARSAGVVARCSTCDSVLMRMVTTPDRVFLDMQGISLLELRPPEM